MRTKLQTGRGVKDECGLIAVAPSQENTETFECDFHGQGRKTCLPIMAALLPLALILAGCAGSFNKDQPLTQTEPAKKAATPFEGHVWTLTETRRVLRDEPPDTNTAVKIAAARNEWKGFQILARTETPVKGVTIEPGDLTGPNGAVIRASDAHLYRQHYMELTTGTYRNDSFKPGWYPDPLIPFAHPVTGTPLKGVRFTAVPFDLPANESHGFWIDLHVPAGTPAGDYRGTYRVVSGSGGSTEIPVTLTVWDFALPRVATLVTAFGWTPPALKNYYQKRAKEGKDAEPSNWPAVEKQCTEMLSAHHFNCEPPVRLTPQAQPDGSFLIPPDQINALRDFVDRYQVNVYSATHPRNVIKDPDTEREKLAAYMKAWDRAATELNRPVLFYIYLKDEPNDAEAYQYVRKWGKAIRDTKSVVKVMVTEQAQQQDEKWGDLYGAIDIWCPLFSLFVPEQEAKRQAVGETIWTYTALCQRDKTPWWHIDYPLLHYRAPAWISWRYRIRGLLYWGGMAYWAQVEDPWTDARTYPPVDKRSSQKTIYNGEGTLVYPARPVGYDGIVPSLRLKALRDSIQDYEYLAILERAGLAAEAEKIVIPLAGSWFKWEPDPAAYDAARAKLADMIVAAKKAGKKVD